MSRRERDTRVRLDGLMSEGQLEIVREIVFGQLIGSAGDLELLHKHSHPKRAVREVAALGRLAFWLEWREILVPDRVAQEVMTRLATEVDGMNERAESTGGDPVAEHDAMWTFVDLLSDWPAAAEVEDALSQMRSSAESRAGGER
jgi:hypothetical protein